MLPELVKTRPCSTTTHCQTLLLCYHENQISHRHTKNVLHTSHNYTIKGKHVAMANRDDLCGWLFAPGHGEFEHYERLGPLPNYLRCSALVIGVAEQFQHNHPIARKPGSTMAQLSVHGVSGAGCGCVERCV